MLEREVKLGAGPAFHLPDLQGVVEGVAVAPPETLRLETVYYDTPDLRLARWGVSLRRREGGGNNGGDGIITPLVALLRTAGAGARDPTPKHIRALGPRATEPPEVAPEPLLPAAAARDVIRHTLAESVASLLRHDPLVRTG